MLPELSHCFRVEFSFYVPDNDDPTKHHERGQGIEAMFKTVSGFKGSLSTSAQGAGGFRHAVQKFGAVSYDPLTLTRGLSRSSYHLYEWFRAWAERDVYSDFFPTRARVTVTQLDATLEKALAKWVYQDCVPTEWSAGSFDAEKSELQIETLKLVHNGAVRLDTTELRSEQYECVDSFSNGNSGNSGNNSGAV